MKYTEPSFAERMAKASETDRLRKRKELWKNFWETLYSFLVLIATIIVMMVMCSKK